MNRPDDLLFRVPQSNLAAFAGCLMLGGLVAVQNGALEAAGISSLAWLLPRSSNLPLSESLTRVLRGADEFRVLAEWRREHFDEALMESIAQVEDELRELPRDWRHDLRVYWSPFDVPAAGAEPADTDGEVCG